MKKSAFLPIIIAMASISGCSTYSAARYSINTDNVVALRALNGKTVNVGAFTATKPGEKEIMCRGVGPIKIAGWRAFL